MWQGSVAHLFSPYGKGRDEALRRIYVWQLYKCQIAIIHIWGSFFIADLADIQVQTSKHSKFFIACKQSKAI